MKIKLTIKFNICALVPHRENHLKLIEKLQDSGSLIFGGSCFPNDGAFILFNCVDQTTPYDFV